LLLSLACLLPLSVHAANKPSLRTGASVRRIPIIDVTDLYQPYEDPGDNFDLVAAYALSELDLRAVILDATEPFRKPVADDPILWHDPNGPRDPGIISVLQLNYIFDRNVPFAVGPFTRMKSLDDQMRDVPHFQQQGIELLLKTLVESRDKVEILSFGSLRVIAAAYNRSPTLFRDRVRRIHISAGSATENYEFGSSADHNEIPGGEWNVGLDPLAFIRLMNSDLPIDWYPCATKDGAFEYGKHNTYWKLQDLEFIQDMEPTLRNYMDFFFSRSARSDFLRAMDVGTSNNLESGRHRKLQHVWETAVWLNVANLQLVQRAGGHYRIVPTKSVMREDKVLPNELLPASWEVRSDGRVRFALVSGVSHLRIYTRPDPAANEQALREALPELYKSFRVPD
jgi:hypothetical protein